MTDTFDILIMNGRPASGKSEIIDFLLNAELETRRSLFHLGDLEVLDDFPMLWAWFEEDHILENELGQPRLHTLPNGDFKDVTLWDLLIRRLGLEYHKFRQESAENASAIIEFSRGMEHGGYRRAYSHLPREVLKRAAILYVHVSFEESLRKNRRRYNPQKPHSVLEHGLSDEKLRALYSDDDFLDFVQGDDQFVEIDGVRVPYAVFENEDDVTTSQSGALGKRLEEVLGRLWRLREVPGGV